MKKNKADELDLEQENPLDQQTPLEHMALDDSRRVKVLSPGMLVFKRFIRNKLAVFGIFILIAMFLFSFLGPLFSSYELESRFFKQEEAWLSYATAKTTQTSYLGEDRPGVHVQALRAIAGTTFHGAYQLKADMEFTVEDGGEQFTVKILNPDPYKPSYAVYGKKAIATFRHGEPQFYDPVEVDDELLQIMQEHVDEGSEDSIDYNGTLITVIPDRVEYQFFVSSDTPIALGGYNSYYPVSGKVSQLQASPEFMEEVGKAIMQGQNSLDYEGTSYTILSQSKDERSLIRGDELLFYITRDYRYGKIEIEQDDNTKVSVDFNSTLADEARFLAAMDEAVAAGERSFSYEDVYYSLDNTDTEIQVLTSDNTLVLTVANNFQPASSRYDSYHEDIFFCMALEKALSSKSQSTTFVFNEERFTVIRENLPGVSDKEFIAYTVQNSKLEDIMIVSHVATGAEKAGTVLTTDFVRKLTRAIASRSDEFNFVNQYGEPISAKIEINNDNYYIKTIQMNHLTDARAGISADHPLGTDIHGQDVLNRLMYGGRVSLLIGFVVVFFEILFGVMIGGMSGYFGSVTDTILMRFVELFDCIPFYPIMLIFGSLLDVWKVNDSWRIFATMAILGILGWTSVARVVRGQILSLREQEFMIATEATGIRTSRRIIRHLVPNVMPLLIVNATQRFGQVILTEATLGFLGLGVRYPNVSWGSIINQATDLQVMKTAWWIWIPAGALILITVLGFNFVGDGLRDAFDPKMKR